MQNDLQFITSITKIADFYSWKLVYCRRLKHDDWKCSLKRPVASLGFDFTHKKANLLPTTKYQSYKRFDNKSFSNALREEFETLKGEFEKKFAVLNTCVFIKIKMITFNNNVFITKELRKEIMKRSTCYQPQNPNCIDQSKNI